MNLTPEQTATIAGLDRRRERLYDRALLQLTLARAAAGDSPEQAAKYAAEAAREMMKAWSRRLTDRREMREKYGR